MTAADWSYRVTCWCRPRSTASIWPPVHARRFKSLAPADRAGLVRIAVGGPVLKSDGTQYVYNYLKRLSTLFVREGK
jgi:hypothetical protein